MDKDDWKGFLRFLDEAKEEELHARLTVCGRGPKHLELAQDTGGPIPFDVGQASCDWAIGAGAAVASRDGGTKERLPFAAGVSCRASLSAEGWPNMTAPSRARSSDLRPPATTCKAWGLEGFMARDLCGFM